MEGTAEVMNRGFAQRQTRRSTLRKYVALALPLAIGLGNDEEIFPGIVFSGFLPSTLRPRSCSGQILDILAGTP